jgi:hypothetical protein
MKYVRKVANKTMTCPSILVINFSILV